MNNRYVSASIETECDTLRRQHIIHATLRIDIGLIESMTSTFNNYDLAALTAIANSANLSASELLARVSFLAASFEELTQPDPGSLSGDGASSERASNLQLGD